MAEFKLTEDEIARLIDEARAEFLRIGPAVSLHETWSRKAARSILELTRQRLIAAHQ